MNKQKLVKELEDIYPNEISGELENSLKTWWTQKSIECASLRSLVENETPENWISLLSHQSCADHPWYSYLEAHAPIHSYQDFFTEESKMPAFIPLLNRCLLSSTCVESAKAIAGNLYDEIYPELHSKLFKNMLGAIGELSLNPEDYSEELTDTNLTYFYGYYCDVDFLVGALLATEFLVPNRTKAMQKGLDRLGIDRSSTVFLKIHSDCDEHHALDWLNSFVLPELQQSIDRKSSFSQGIACRILTSNKYLDFKFSGIKSSIKEVSVANFL